MGGELGMLEGLALGVGPFLSQPPIESLPAAATPRLPDAQAKVLAQRKEAEGDAFYRQGRFPAALELYGEAVSLQPSVPGYHYKLGSTAQKVDARVMVETHLLEAIRLDPKFALAHSALGQWYAWTGRLDLALQYSASARALDPNDCHIVMSRALVLSAAGDSKGVWELIEPLVFGGVTHPWLALAYSRIAPAMNHEQKAVELIRRVLLAADLPAGERPQLHFEAASLLNRLGRYDEAFEQARLANGLVRRPYSSAANLEEVSNKIRYLTRRKVESLPLATHGNRRPVFIVGMPRSGTSLVEQILASHPLVFGAGEVEALGRISREIPDASWAEGERYPECLESLSSHRANRLASKYLAEMESLNAEATYVTDKMPSNYQHLHLIELLFPGCHVIHCTRSALDTCLSCYFTDFASGNEFSFDLANLGAHYRDYRRLMDHWKKVLSLSILEIRYEDLVLDTQGQVGRMLEFLELPWDERCLKYYDNKRRVKTASEDQVRRPIYTSSIGRWKHYEKHLAELIGAMGR
jgi:tetratricopeptide (TPR) repeat protein